MERAAGEDKIADKNVAAIACASTSPKKRTRQRPAATDEASSSAAGGICDDTVGSILARLPARTAIACMTLSKRHQSLICSPEFRSLQCHLAPPLPRPHIAYLATAPIRGASGYYGFHLAGAGLTGSGDALIRSVAGWRYLGTKYVNTCNGVVLLATKGFSDQCRCILWNPAIADVAREVTIPKPSPKKKKTESIFLPDGMELRDKKTLFLPLGLGYGRRSNTCKLLFCCVNRHRIHTLVHGYGATHHFEYSLVVHSLGGDTTDNKETQLRTVRSIETVLSHTEQVDDKEIIQNKSLYMDGKIYFLHLKKYVIFAFDVDDETVRTTDMLGERHRAYMRHSDLIEMSGRPCLVITQKDCITLWQLTANYQLEPIHAISYEKASWEEFSDHKIVGIWDCGSIVFLWFHVSRFTAGELLLYDVTAKKIFRGYLPHSLAANYKCNHMLCWGYKPTLVSPESIVGEFDQDMERRRDRSAHITEVRIVCRMEFLVRIMQKLPQDLQDVVEMPKMDSEEPGLLFQCLTLRSIDT